VHEHGELRRKRQYDLCITSFASGDDLACRSLCALRQQRQGIGNAKPGVLRPMPTFKGGVTGASGTHQPRANAGHHDAVFANSARNPSDNPTNANLLALYGSKCGTLTLPPIEEMLTMRPSRRCRIPGKTAKIL
jgi:hypothetical protein